MYAEMIEKLNASNMKLFTYPSEIEVFTSLSQIVLLFFCKKTICLKVLIPCFFLFTGVSYISLCVI